MLRVESPSLSTRFRLVRRRQRAYSIQGAVSEAQERRWTRILPRAAGAACARQSYLAAASEGPLECIAKYGILAKNVSS